jgi:Acetyltransferase (GNAT) domain
LIVEAEISCLAKGSGRAVDPLVPTVFHEPWWLEAATSGRYEQVEVSDGNRLVGRLSYSVEKLFGRKVSVLPTLTHVLGPAIREGSGSANTRLLHNHAVTRELIAKLPRLHRFRQKLHRGHAEVLSFQSEGFRTGVQFTFEIQPQSELEVWNKLRNKTRNVIRRAQEELEQSELTDVDEFLNFYEHNLMAAGKQMLIHRGECAAVCSAALERNAGKIICARDAAGRLMAAVFLAWDHKAAYYLMSTRTVDSRNGAISLLIWNCMRFCAARDIVFDFDGVANEGSILLFVGFGGEPKPRYMVTRETKRVVFADTARRVLGLLGKENFFDRF